MQNQNTQTKKRIPGLGKKIISAIILISMIVQMLSVSVFAFDAALELGSGSSGGKGSLSIDGIGDLTSDELIAELKKQYIGSLNEDLVVRIEDLELKGEVGAIISFSDN